MNLEPSRPLCRRAFKWRCRWWTLPALLCASSRPPTHPDSFICFGSLLAFLPHKSSWSSQSLNGLGKGPGQQTACHERRLIVWEMEKKLSFCSRQEIISLHPGWGSITHLTWYNEINSKCSPAGRLIVILKSNINPWVIPWGETEGRAVSPIQRWHLEEEDLIASSVMKLSSAWSSPSSSGVSKLILGNSQYVLQHTKMIEQEESSCCTPQEKCMGWHQWVGNDALMPLGSEPRRAQTSPDPPSSGWADLLDYAFPVQLASTEQTQRLNLHPLFLFKPFSLSTHHEWTVKPQPWK